MAVLRLAIRLIRRISLNSLKLIELFFKFGVIPLYPTSSELPYFDPT